jgi:cation:H+ antiporter
LRFAPFAFGLRVTRLPGTLTSSQTVGSLPEIATTFTAAIQENANLVLGNLFGGITMQTAILAVADLYVVRGVLTQYPRKPTHALEAALLIVLLSTLLGFCISGDVTIGFNMGLGAAVLAVAYALCVMFLRNYDEAGHWIPVDLPNKIENKTKMMANQSIADLPTGTLIRRSVAAAIVILVCGVILVQAADAIATQTGLGSSFIGATILAASTSLPEVSTTIAAARLGAYTMAISNIFGSNLIMLVLLLPADALYRKGPILAEAGQTEMLNLVFGILVTAIFVVGMLVRRKPRILGMGIDSASVLAVYVCSLFILYFTR